MSSELGELPTVYLRIVPDLEEIHWPREVLSTCADCAMQRRGPGQIVFTARARCCTYQPAVPNYLVGRILRRGDLGTEKMLERLRKGAGVGPRMVRGDPELVKRYQDRVGTAFGRDDALTCPYWVEGDLGCSIHRDRNAICRTWFCKTLRGGRGNRAWMALKDLLRCLEHTLIEVCMEDGDPPKRPASLQAWMDWYIWCAERIDRMDDAEIASLRGERLAQLVEGLHRRARERDAELPDVVVPHVQSWKGDEDGITMVGWSNTDPARMPAWIFVLLSQFDGERTWWEARAAAEAELDERVSDDLILTLWRRGLLDVAPDDEGMPADPELDEGEE